MEIYKQMKRMNVSKIAIWCGVGLTLLYVSLYHLIELFAPSKFITLKYPLFKGYSATFNFDRGERLRSAKYIPQEEGADIAGIKGSDTP